jgi:predicted 3-demethylubiquinone-9 3-methyltransferase (glyoxalase superfamily)
MSDTKLQRITPCFGFDHQAQEAAEFYTAIFPDSKVGRIVRYTPEGAGVSGRAEGSVMTVEFTLDGQAFIALNGGPVFKFTEAISMTVHCRSQAEVDHYWSRLGDGGPPEAQQCGWLKDRFGVSWQVVPTELQTLMADPDPARARRVAAEVLAQKKLDLAALRRAAAG